MRAEFLRGHAMKLMLLALLTVPLAAHTREHVRPLFCSIARGEPLSRSPQETYFLGTATADSVLAGVGTLLPERATSRPVYGQRIRIESLSVTASRELAALRRTARPDVVVVPWDFDESCRLYHWTKTVLWVTPGRTSFFGARLRDRQHWAGDIPTFDIEMARFQPYPQRIEDGPPGTNPIAPLSAAEMFSLNESLPMAGDTSAKAYAPFAEWQRRHPGLALRFPVDRVAFLVIEREVNSARASRGVISIEEIIADITQFKRYVLLDTAKIDFCGVRDAFDANGLFRQPADVAPPRYTNIGQCRAVPEDSRHGPVVLNVKTVGDTVIVSGFTKRGSFGFIEEFRYTPNPFARSPQSRWQRLYKIIGTVDS